LLLAIMAQWLGLSALGQVLRGRTGEGTIALYPALQKGDIHKSTNFHGAFQAASGVEHRCPVELGQDSIHLRSSGRYGLIDPGIESPTV
jgi:hypothetical protein